VTDDRDLQAVRALISAARAVGRGTTSMRVTLGMAHALVPRELVPAGLADELWPDLEEAAAAVEPLAFKDVEKQLKDAWGAKPADELDDLEREPAIVTAATQTHHGTREGARVAVTVLRPGLARIVRADLALADQLVGPARAAFPGVDVQAVVRQARERTLDDLDLEHVAGRQRTLARALRNHEDLGVAAPVTELCHHEVLVREHVEGTPILELTDDGDRACAAELLLRFAGGAARHGTIVADLRADTLVLDRRGRLVVLEAAGIADVGADRADLVVTALEALASGDDDALAAVITGLGALPAEQAVTAARLGRELLGEVAAGGSVRLSLDVAVEVLGRVDARLDEVLALAGHASLPPADLWPLRGLGQVVVLVLRLGGTLDWLTVARDAARDGW